MKLEHTPGPWSTDLDDFHDLCVYDKDGEWLANLADKIADARLIAAAPEMLSALIECKYMLDMVALGATSERLPDLIEKATGKTWEELNA